MFFANQPFNLQTFVLCISCSFLIEDAFLKVIGWKRNTRYVTSRPEMPKQIYSHLNSTPLHTLIIAFFTASALLAVFAFLVSPGALARSESSAELVEILSYEDENCYVLTHTPDPEALNHSSTRYLHIPVPYTGTVTEAQLLLASNNVGSWTNHPIRVNGEVIGTVAHDTRHGCAPFVVTEYPITPTLLHPGTNDVTLTQAGTSDVWSVRYAAIRVRGVDLKGSTFEYTQFPGENGQTGRCRRARTR